MLFKRDAEELFEVHPITSTEMEQLAKLGGEIYQGKPPWADDDIQTINFAKVVCSEIARLSMLATKITVDGSARADWLQGIVNTSYFKMREWVEYAAAYGTVIIKPNGAGLDLFLPNQFMVTSTNDKGDIDGVVFYDSYVVSETDKKKHYTRLEYHRFTSDGVYAISNRAYKSENERSLGDKVDLKLTRWADLDEDVTITKENDERLNSPLFGVLKSPQANNVDIGSPLGMPCFADALTEIEDIDVAYSRNSLEIRNSKRIVLLDADKLVLGGNPKQQTNAFKHAKEQIDLPEYVKNVIGDGANAFYQEINPNLQTSVRLEGLNALISLAGYKCGFSAGYFVYNGRTGMITATQVEADDRRTIQFIKDWRDKIEKCMDDVLYALSVMADLYEYAPVGEYEITYDFGDITYNREEDRARWWNYVAQGKVPAWKYFVKFEGMSEDEAKEMITEAQAAQLEAMPSLFGEE